MYKIKFDIIGTCQWTGCLYMSVVKSVIDVLWVGLVVIGNLAMFYARGRSSYSKNVQNLIELTAGTDEIARFSKRDQ